MLNKMQRETLLRPLKSSRVLVQQNQSHLPGFDVIAHLSRIFGVEGWDKEILSLTVVSERETKTGAGKPAWAITYACTMRLTIRDPEGNVVKIIEDGACGSSTQPQLGEAHDMALKSAITYAVKRCAKDLGDQFGLSLYNKGSLSQVLSQSVAYHEAPIDESSLPKPMSMGNDELHPEEAPSGQVALASKAAAVEAAAAVKEGGWVNGGPIDPEDPESVWDEAAPENAPGFTLEEPPVVEPKPASISSVQQKRLHALRNDLGLTEDRYRAGLLKLTGVSSSKDLTQDQAAAVIEALASMLKQQKAEAGK